jgi:hypothetical protein
LWSTEPLRTSKHAVSRFFGKNSILRSSVPQIIEFGKRGNVQLP